MEYALPIDSLEELPGSEAAHSTDLTDGDDRDSLASLDRTPLKPSVSASTAATASGSASASAPVSVAASAADERPRELRRDRILTADDASSISSSPKFVRGGPMASPLRRPPSALSLGSATSSSHDRRRAATGKTPPEERTGFARIYFENQNFTSSTVFKLFANTTVLEVRKSMANKIKIPLGDFEYFVIVVVFPTDGALLLFTFMVE